MASSWSSTGCSGHSCNSWCRRALRAETGPCSRAASSTHACWMSTASPAQFLMCCSSDFKLQTQRSTAQRSSSTAPHSTVPLGMPGMPGRVTISSNQLLLHQCYAISTTSYTSGLLQDVFTTVSLSRTSCKQHAETTNHTCVYSYTSNTNDCEAFSGTTCKTALDQEHVLCLLCLAIQFP